MHFVATREGEALHIAHRHAEGAAPTLAFSNSLGTDFRVWDPLVRALPPALGIVRYDSRGHGLSSLGATPYAIADHVDDLSRVLSQADAGPVVLVGLSVGGLIAQAFALAHPDNVKALVLMCTGARIMDEARWSDRMAQVEAGGLEPLLEGNMERWFSPAFRTPQNALYEGMRTMFRRQSAAAYLATCATLRDTDLRDEIGAIACPVLCIAGELDGSTPPDLVKSMADGIPGASTRVIEGVGHIPCVEAPERVAAAITGFLSDNGFLEGTHRAA